MSQQMLSVELPEETWTLIYCLVKRGLVHELSSSLLGVHEAGCIPAFTDALKALNAALPVLVAKPLGKKPPG